MFLLELCCFLWFLMCFKGVLCEEYEFDWRGFETALTSPDSIRNETNYGCVWRSLSKAQCFAGDINYYYYSGAFRFNKQEKKLINPFEENSFSETNWDPQKHNIIFIHGFGGGDGVFSTDILKNAYVRNGSYNFFVVDWSPLSRLPCYTAAIFNLNAVAKCTAYLYKSLHMEGTPAYKITCVGHGLGAHGCGVVSNYLNFRMHRIIGLDPSGPMVPNSLKLKPSLANSVEVIHTNAGTFGDSSSSGRVNFCINGGKFQPLCKDTSFEPNLCSHMLSICFMAGSINSLTALKGRPCTRQCPYGPRGGLTSHFFISLGQHAPERATGSYCVSTNDMPFCSKENGVEDHPWCCRKNSDKNNLNCSPGIEKFREL